MNLTSGPARLGLVAALFALLLGSLAVGSQTAHAQGPDSAQYYGTGLAAGDTVSASVDGVECGSTTADADGNWLLVVAAGDPCGPDEGDTVNFSVNGEVAEQTESWTGGGTPADAANGISLTVAEMGDGMGDGDGDGDGMGDGDGDGMGDGDGDGMGDGDGDMAVEPPDTGNAGLAAATSSSSAFAARPRRSRAGHARGRALGHGSDPLTGTRSGRR